MPRANRYFLPGYVRHILTAPSKNFPMKFARDRRRYFHWVFWDFGPVFYFLTFTLGA